MKKINQGLRYFLFTFLFLFCSIQGIAQIFNQQICGEIFYDTLDGVFIAELNADEKYYLVFDAVLQPNLIYPDRTHSKTDVGLSYRTDTVVLAYDAKVFFKRFSNQDSCLNLPAISNLMNNLDTRLVMRSKRKDLRKASIIDGYGTKYVKFYAKLIVIDVGQGEYIIPPHLATTGDRYDADSGTYFRNYSHRLLIADIIDFKYRQ